MSKPSARKPTVLASGSQTSIVRTAVAAVLVVLGIAWMVVYYTVARDGPGPTRPEAAEQPAPVHGRPRQLELPDRLRPDLRSAWSSPPTRPPRSAAAAAWSVGMLGCFLIGLVWIVPSTTSPART